MKTYTEDDLTPWFPPDITPVRSGVYQVELSSGALTYQHWNRQFWGFYISTPSGAYRNRHRKSSTQGNYWRGLNKQP